MESLGSDRIEGNNTTIAEYVETKIGAKRKQPDEIQEIQNLEDSMDFVERVVKNHSLNRAFISEIQENYTRPLSSS
jgi:Fic family protein